ncbi:hypothetical protein GCM10010279_56460 [Streptomyces mutabilis]|nr:hypothetical protein GCM10010279_56460 [Streptomyces mutabilis]
MTLCFQLPSVARFSQRPEAFRVVDRPARAPVRTLAPTPVGLCQVNRAQADTSSFEGVANGGDSAIAMAGRVIVGLLCVHEAVGHMHSWVCRRQLGFPFEGRQPSDGEPRPPAF